MWANESSGTTSLTLAGDIVQAGPSPVFLRYGGVFVVLGQFGARTSTSKFNRRRLRTSGRSIVPLFANKKYLLVLATRILIQTHRTNRMFRACRKAGAASARSGASEALRVPMTPSRSPCLRLRMASTPVGVTVAVVARDPSLPLRPAASPSISHSILSHPRVSERASSRRRRS